MVDAAHSRFSASSAARWMACPGSMALSKGLPDTSSVYADEGTAAHSLASWCLADWSAGTHADGDWPKPAKAFLGRIIQAGEREFTVDDDMARDVQIYLDNIAEYAIGADAVLIEVRVNYSAHLGVNTDEGWGTSDVVILKQDEVQVHDLKYGRGEQVEAEENVQCKLYALGAHAEYDGLAGDFTHARMVIHQVRTNPRPIEWDCPVGHLLDFALLAKTAADRADLASYARSDEVTAYLQPGEKQCRFCKAKATCPALREEVALTMAGAISAPLTADDFEDLTIIKPDEGTSADYLALAMGKADLVEMWLKAVRAETERRLLAGTPVDGWKLVQGKRGNRAWTSEEEAEAMLKSFRLKQEEMYSFKVISPTTAEKLLKDASPKRWKKAQALITQSEGGKSVAPMSDKRPAIEVTPVADEFEDLGAAGSETQTAETFDDLA